MRRTGSALPRRTCLPDARLALALAILAAPAAVAGEVAPYAVEGDAIPWPLTETPGDATRGRAIVADRQRGLCLLCHAGPFPDQPFQGNLAPDLAGAGSRWTPAQLRLRLVDGKRLNPGSIMPSYHRAEGLSRVAPALRGKPLLGAQEIEDVVAFLATLREEEARP